MSQIINPFDPANFLEPDVESDDIEAGHLLEALPEDYHEVNLESAVRLTPATLAFHITKGLWHPSPHLLLAATEIARALLEGNAHIIFSMPARHGKSELASVWTPTWWLDLFPQDHVILSTYASDLSQTFGRRVRDTFIELGGVDGKPAPDHIVAGRPRLHTTVRSDVQQVGHFQTPQGGGMTSVGIGGPITGRGANILLIDDYVKNAKEAASPAHQIDTFEWFQSTAYTRLEPGGSVVILATRWDQNDLIGQILKNRHNFPVPWKVIEFPALAHPNEVDPLGRKPGEALWPTRYSRERLLQTKAILGAYFWAAMYQQRPIARTDVKFEEGSIEVIDSIPQGLSLRSLRSWDLAATLSKKADFTSGMLMSMDGPSRATKTCTYLEDLVHGKWSDNKLEEVIRETAESDGYGVPIIIEQEPGSSGKQYAQHLKNNVLGDFRVTVRAPQSDKWLKAQPFIGATSRGKVKMLRAAWNKKLLDEFKDFPSVEHDDIVDSVSQGYNELNSTKNQSVTWGRTVNTQDGAKNSDSAPLRGATFGRK